MLFYIDYVSACPWGETVGSLSGHPTVSSGRHSCNAEHNGKANEKIPSNIAQIQKAAARYSYCTYDSYDRQHSHNNACNFANGLFHGDPPYHFRFIDCDFILLSQLTMFLTFIWGRVRGSQAPLRSSLQFWV